MIPQFLVSNIDAVITTVLGALFTIYAFRKREILSSSANSLTRLLPVLAPIVFFFGLIQFFLPNSASDAAPAWRVVETDDGIARVDFPTTPVRTEATDRAGEIEVHRVSRVADLAGGKLNLRLSFNEYPPESEGLSDTERIAGMKEFFIQGGFEIVEDAELKDGIWTLLVAKPNDKARLSMRIAIMPNGIYRALATSLDGYHDDARIDRFLNSFTATKNELNKAEIATPRKPSD